MGQEKLIKLLALKLSLVALCKRLSRGLAHDSAIAKDAPKWITVHPNGKGPTASGENAKGTPVLMEEETGEVLGGMGGKYNGVHISEACSKVPSEHIHHLVLRGQKKREDPEGFAKRQKEAEERVKKTLQEQQEAAKKEAEELKAKQEAAKKEAEKAKQEAEAKAKQEAEKAKQEAETKSATETEQQSKSPMQHLSATSSAAEINKAFDSIEQVSAFNKLSKEQIMKAKKIKADAIKSLYHTNDIEAANAFKERAEKLGAPPEKFANLGEARAYYNKLMPHAHWCLDSVDEENARAVMLAAHTMISRFPVVGKYITAIGNQANAKQYAGANHDAQYFVNYEKFKEPFLHKYDSGPERERVQQHCDAALKKLFDGKSPPTEERANEFYKNFGKYTGHNLRNALNKDIKNKSLTPSKELKTEAMSHLVSFYINKDTMPVLSEYCKKKYGEAPDYDWKEASGLINVSYKMGKKTYAHCQQHPGVRAAVGGFKGTNTAIQLSDQYRYYDTIVRGMKQDISIGYHPVVAIDPAASLFIHEMGHSLDYAMLYKGKPMSEHPGFVEIYKKAKAEEHGNRYFKKDVKEFWAECVTAGISGALDKNPKCLQDGFNWICGLYDKVYSKRQ